MKKTFLYSIVLLSVIICSFKTVKPDARPTAKNDRLIKVIFNRKLTFDELVKIKNDLHQKHIDLTYKMMAFDESGHLTKIDFEVNCNDGFKGGASADHLTNRSDFGFYRDYSKGVTSPFGAGGINEVNK